MTLMFRQLLSGLKSWHDARGERHVHKHLTKLQELPFFHSIYFGASKSHRCQGWLTADGCFASGSPLSIVIHNKGKLSGVIGFELLPGGTMLVRLMQGAPDAGYPHGVKAPEYLTTCTEQIARALHMKTLRTISAETVISYRHANIIGGHLTDHETQRLKNMYTYVEKRGYTKSFCLRLRESTYKLRLNEPWSFAYFLKRLHRTAPHKAQSSLGKQLS